MKNDQFLNKTIISIVSGLAIVLGLNYIVDAIQLGPALLGYSIVAINFAVVIWAWSRIFVKKTIALAFAVIVFKYAILGLILYQMIVKLDIDSFSFAIGLSMTAVLVTTLAVMHYFSLRRGEI